MLKSTEAVPGETAADWCRMDGTVSGIKARCQHCQHAHPHGSTAVLSTSADHQSPLATLPGKRFTVVLASPAQTSLPQHLPRAVNLQQQHTATGAMVTCDNPYEHTPSHWELQSSQPPSIYPRRTYVSHAADTHDLQCDWILVTATGELASALGAVRARAGAAVVARSQDRVSIVASLAPAQWGTWHV